MEGAGGLRDLQLQVDEGESGGDRPRPEADGNAPPLEPELEAGRGRDAVSREVLGHGSGILPWNAPRGEKALLLLRDLGRLAAMNDE